MVEVVKLFREMEKRKSAIIEALVAQTNVVADAHLKISTQDIPEIFRKGLYYKTSVHSTLVEDDESKCNKLEIEQENGENNLVSVKLVEVENEVVKQNSHNAVENTNSELQVVLIFKKY